MDSGSVKSHSGDDSAPGSSRAPLKDVLLGSGAMPKRWHEAMLALGLRLPALGRQPLDGSGWSEPPPSLAPHFQHVVSFS